MAARAQLEQMRRALPPGGLAPGMPTMPGSQHPQRPQDESGNRGTGQYL
jgi:hypothetical protein